MPRDHVLTKTFYLLRDFPGRFNSGQLWVEALPAANDEDEARAGRRAAGDGVSSIIITSNDFAGAWAMRPDGQPMLPMVAGRAAPARTRLPRRRQHRDVHADRQLQGRPGARAGAARAARAIGGDVEFRRRVRPARPRQLFWAAIAAAAVLALLLLVSRSRGARVRALALALIVLALANPSFTREDRDPLSSVAVVVVDKSPSQNFGDRTQQTEEARAALGRAAQPHSRPRSARGRGRPVRRRDRRHAAVYRARLGACPMCRPTASPAPS